MIIIGIKIEIQEAAESVANFHGLDLFIPDEIEMCLLETVELLKGEGAGGPSVKYGLDRRLWEMLKFLGVN